MKIYTKTGDKGTTALFGGTRVPKHHIRIESYGTVDELNSHLGLIRDQDIHEDYKDLLIKIQDRLFTLGAILATDPEKAILKNGKARLNIDKISTEDIERLEIGYSVLPQFWGRGYASEAALKCKNYAFEHNFSDVLMSMIHVDNISSKKVALINGMTFEKQIKNFNIFSIHKERWELTQ